MSASISNGQSNTPASAPGVSMPDESVVQSHPFTTEDEYWALVLARLEVRHWLHQNQARRASRRTAAPGHNPGVTLTVLSEHQAALARQDAHLLEVYRTRRAWTAPQYPAPRILRLAARLGLAEAEGDVLHYLILMACESAFSGAATEDECSAGDIADILGLNPVAFFALLDPVNPLHRYDLIQIDSRPVEAPRQRRVSMDLTLIKALRGLALTDEERDTLGEGVLCDVLREEPGMWRAVALPEPPGNQPVSASDAPARCDDNHAGHASEVIEDVVTSTDHVPTAEHTPYTTDLEYLEDHLSWFKARHRWKVLMENDEDAENYDHSTDNLTWRIREAQTQERVWRHRIERRLLHTRTTGTWLPRAERLATSRQLDTFEKHVLLVLTGVTVSSECQRVLGRHRRLEEVGTFLSLFWRYAGGASGCPPLFLP